eukprot:8679855-Lingulodinium_polyedra.AAC.1
MLASYAVVAAGRAKALGGKKFREPGPEDVDPGNENNRGGATELPCDVWQGCHQRGCDECTQHHRL